ncbi:hypothetical protein C7S16_1202 [Burkholderia thailandensis]|uniref:Uncharacterized protein n=1 Tax=Burkholderia thailandensis TaxID=57975 RepID=A0AAW9CW94_BURTH|nr:hypothetical protein [Burkholderia thailandensis]
MPAQGARRLATSLTFERAGPARRAYFLRGASRPIARLRAARYR